MRSEALQLSSFIKKKKRVHPFTRAGGRGFTAKIVVVNGAQRCELHNRAVCRWVEWELSSVQFLLLPFWSRGTQRATLKDLPPTQRCIDSVYSGVRSEALQLSSFIKKKRSTSFHPGGRAGFHCKDCVNRELWNSLLLTFSAFERVSPPPHKGSRRGWPWCA